MRSDRTITPRLKRRGLIPLMWVGEIALLVACTMTALIPVTKTTAAMNLGRTVWQVDGNLVAAERIFLQATEDDPLSPEPWQELSHLRLARWMQTRKDDVFERAVAAQRKAITRDPMNAVRWRALGALWTKRYKQQPHPEFVEQAIPALREAVKRHPHLAVVHAELAIAAHKAGKPALVEKAARWALHLQVINRQRKHTDKYLTRAQMFRLNQLLATVGVDSTDSAN